MADPIGWLDKVTSELLPFQLWEVHSDRRQEKPETSCNWFDVLP